MENRKVVDQRVHPALSLLAARPELFVWQGSVVASRRSHGEQSNGPYYRLSYRDGSRQCSIYLGRESALVERVRHALGRLQQNRRQHQTVERMRRQVQASLRVQKLRVDALLRPWGLRMKGFETRGWRSSPLKKVFASLQFRPLNSANLVKRGKQAQATPRTPQARIQAFLDARDRKKAEHGRQQR